MCRTLCEIKREICREAAITNEVTTTVTFTIDAYGNLDITDGSAEFGGAIDAYRNLSGNGSLIERFYTDPYKNMKYKTN